MPHVEVVEQPKISQTEEEKEAELGLETAPGTVLGQEEVTVMEGEEPKTVLYTRVRGIGDFSLAYDAETFSVEASADSLTFQAGLLDELSRPWTVRINREVERCEKAAERIGILCKELKLAGGLDYNQVKGFKETQKVTEDARAQFYFAVDQLFRQWLQEIDPEQDDPDEAVQRWEAQARRIAKELGAKMVREAGKKEDLIDGRKKSS